MMISGRTEMVHIRLHPFGVNMDGPDLGTGGATV